MHKASPTFAATWAKTGRPGWFSVATSLDIVVIFCGHHQWTWFYSDHSSKLWDGLGDRSNGTGVCKGWSNCGPRSVEIHKANRIQAYSTLECCLSQLSNDYMVVSGVCLCRFPHCIVATMFGVDANVRLVSPQCFLGSHWSCYKTVQAK